MFMKKEDFLSIGGFDENFKVKDIKSLNKAKKNEITFFDSIKYKDLILLTNASVCITNQKLEKYLPRNLRKIIVKNVLVELARITSILYPFSELDLPDLLLKNPKKILFTMFNIVTQE